MTLTVLALLASGCGVLSTKEDQQRAQELAEAVYPGELRVVGARTLFPETTGSEVTYALRDDPDAFVRLRVEAGHDRCGGQPCAQALRDARGRGEAAAAEWRVLKGEFARCGYEVHAASVKRGTVTDPWIAQALSNGNVEDVLARIGDCLRRYSRALPAEQHAGRTSVTVHLADPSQVRELPAGREGDPALLRRTAPGLHAALAGRSSYAVTYTWRDGVVRPESGTARIVRPFEDRQEFKRKVHASAAEWLKGPHPRAELAQGYGGAWSLLPARVDRLRGWVLFCESPGEKGKRCLGNSALALTVDLEGRLVGEPTVVSGIRDGRGALRLPPLD
ncbi:SCO7460 family lipoprotein [Streptomyces ovatisporus]|uniref:SCO7460 family lipoprotein n=2 Tax=Streptomyces ovatisporus TaxID=1128682 RepID=A0ABV9A208_9ACTN